jgi:hypothetical protein
MDRSVPVVISTCYEYLATAHSPLDFLLWRALVEQFDRFAEIESSGFDRVP